MGDAQSLLEVVDIHAGYGSSHVLHGISLHIGSGEFVTLLGRNGMGKTTTIKCIMGLLRTRTGSLRFAGQDTTRRLSYQIARAGIGLVPEGRQIFPNLSVEENLIATARPPALSSMAPWSLQRVYELFPRLKERRENPGTRLSGGEQQMLAIGRALMTNPRLLILDEATEGLAPLVRQDIWNALHQLKQTGMAILCVD